MAGGGTYILKSIISIDRPPGIALRSTYSYPSAHTTLVIALLGYIYFLVSTKKNYNIYRIALSTVVLSMILSRILLSAHWFSDVLGGLTWGLSILFINAAIMQGIQFSKKDRNAIIIISILTISILWLYQIIFNLNNEINNYRLIK